MSVSGKAKGSKTIIKNVSGCVPPGTLMAIMGSSGAGKSTLMNVIAGRNLGNLVIDGNITINGLPAGTAMTKISAYVQQDDIFIGSMTVYEHLVFQAALRMSKETKDFRLRRVDEVIKEMGLTKCKETLIGTPGMSKTISGGEMKRLSFASEILTNPAVIFCDEPTSGLDSYLAETVIATLQRLANSGTNILCTIHQPSSQVFGLFNRLLLLAQGNIAYLGSTRKAASFFDSIGLPIPQNYNPCDHYIENIALIPGEEEKSYRQMEEICYLFKQSKIYKKNEKKKIKRQRTRESAHQNQLVRREKPAFLTTLWWLFWRACISHYRDTTFAVMKLSQNLGVAFVIGLLFLRVPWKQPYTTDDVQMVTSALFVMVTAYSMCFMFLVLLAFPLQVPVLRREHYGGLYTILAAFIAETLASLPFLIVMPLFYTIIIYFLCGFAPGSTQFFWAYFGNVLIAIACTGYGYFISGLARNVKAANTIAPSLLIPLFLLSGFFIPAKEVPVYFIPFQYISWFYYGVELLIINQWDGTDLCVSFGLDSFGLPVPDDCFGTANPNPTVLPEQNVTFPDGITLPPGLSPPPLDDWRNELEDLIFSNDSCLQKDLTRCPERICFD